MRSDLSGSCADNSTRIVLIRALIRLLGSRGPRSRPDCPAAPDGHGQGGGSGPTWPEVQGPVDDGPELYALVTVNAQSLPTPYRDPFLYPQGSQPSDAALQVASGTLVLGANGALRMELVMQCASPPPPAPSAGTWPTFVLESRR